MSTADEVTKKPRRRFVGVSRGENKVSTKQVSGDEAKELVRSAKSNTGARRAINQIPDEILNDENLQEAIKLLPSNYNFEIHKTVWNIRKHNAKRVALQMPEGLLIYSLVISDILEQFCNCETVVMGDVSYGACCIDDFTARALGCDFIVHYAHSCLVPVDVTSIKILYVFVTIGIDEDHLMKTLQKNFAKGTSLAVFGTIQFNPAIHSIREKLLYSESHMLYITPPQIKPLSKGEVLGCTSQRLPKEQFAAMVYVGDGRFHLESAMIHNPDIPAFRYDPYSRKFTRETYDQHQLVEVRSSAIEKARNSQCFGLILGALGRQGNLATVANLEKKLRAAGKKVVRIILSEIFPQKLAMFDHIDAFVQVACPRLSIDWGYAFNKPLLTPYETNVMLGQDRMFNEKYYPMDYYEVNGYGRGKQPTHDNVI
ncbi:ADL229Wp [Eremothecium gossypii ATCC 10895]|uniref:2-(3-amino-3-carboxypropyl)histidine synthase subunit 1 n=1 Tax=Eremothecium gossypii (strain ATCC 10895 / CBS 109.51 / FGSC 9923 / NRRL Y-1056) TaxID=284811 RepID=DPH1_EREGS|nr:ADL229Wp [Eremothecium gossypii ATCC 10895]Q75AZ9.1 RecName: Full=2-(3-amino-3-carboxypropyl)histidine synthase subunit 1; AltName: Full=Diphthamide biosynthesis protein 1; AltName: Full=Diphtheria toxin resistance protein 1; AltName: Full=S-adenosyl-L-methionine:L-histidine 3-amino-3-carboxypropyltransferase 1 [Eremothecium gossypii ATCC 10895]AAS51691.1 ADL229Wp [Eremothecium gossypii ATCC 10895]AEY95988.1 FADL229Wp [Eremothecium gossypii FDAG1]